MSDSIYGAIGSVPDRVLIVDQFGNPMGTGLTDSELRASPVPVTGPLTDAQLRAVAVAISAASLPLPADAATQTTLLTLAKSTDITALIDASYNLIAAQIIPVGTTTFNIAVNPKFPHTFLSVIPCNASGTYTASATGAASITVESVNSPGFAQVPAESSISMAAPTDLSFGGNLLSVRGTVTGLASTHYRVGISQNKA
ncbi:MAG: hypothetical protein ACK5LG_21950 [Bacteroides thetaiotaomicron]